MAKMPVKRKKLTHVGLPYQRQSSASQAAATRFKPYVKTARYKVYEFIQRHPHCCDRDIVLGLPMNPNTVRPRRVELERMGLIRADGLTITPDTKADATAFVVTNKPWPDPWPSTKFTYRKTRSERPTPEEFQVAVDELKEAQRQAKRYNRPFAAETDKIIDWIERQAE